MEAGTSMSRITPKRRLKEKRGTGTGADYKPWLQAREVGSIGTESVFCDWKHGRQIQCLSQGEARTYYLLRWRDDVVDIREQFPLDISITMAIARRFGLPHPHDAKTYMTTDFLVTYLGNNNTQFLKAYSVKPDITHMNKPALQSFAIEQAYWGIKGIHLEMIYSDNLNKIFASNIKQCVAYYKPESIQTRQDYIKHLISRKVLIVDMESNYLDFPAIAEQYPIPTKIPMITTTHNIQYEF